MNNKIKSESITKKRIRKFKSIKRGYYSFIILMSLFLFSLFAPLFINDAALIVKHNEKYYFPFINKIINDSEFLSKYPLDFSNNILRFTKALSLHYSPTLSILTT